MKLNVMKLMSIGFKVKPFQSVLLCILILGASITPALEIFLLKKVVTAINSGLPVNTVAFIIVLYLLMMYLVPQILGKIRGNVQLFISHFIDEEIIRIVFLKTSKVPLPVLENGKALNSIHRVTKMQTDGIQSYFQQILGLFSNIICLVSVMAILDWLGIVLTAFIFVCIIPLMKWETALTKKEFNFNKSMEEENRYTGAIKSLLFNRLAAPEMFIYGNRSIISDKWLGMQRAIDKKSNIHRLKQSKARVLINTFRDVRLGICLAIIVGFFSFGSVPAALAISAIYGSLKIMTASEDVVSNIAFIVNQRMIIDEFNSVMDLEEEPVTGKKMSDQPPEIVFKNVSYKYSGSREEALKNISLTIKSGEKVVLVGNNGSGKSTLIRLMLGLDKPTVGGIHVNGELLEDVLTSLRENSTVMFQDFFRYELSLKDNIVISNLQKQEEDALLASTVHWAGVNGIISNISNGLDTDMVAGGKLSGGEWQRVSMARTKFRTGRFVALDEPNAAVDALYEIEMYKKFIDLFHDCTSVVVSHRLPICQLCDKIIVMDHGEIIEYGSHNELLKTQNGYYRTMYNAQALLYS